MTESKEWNTLIGLHVLVLVFSTLNIIIKVKEILKLFMKIVHFICLFN